MKVAVPTLDDLFAVISAATFGDASARVALPDDPPVDDAATRTAIALNVLLDDLAFRNRATEQMAARLRTLADSAQAFSLATHDSEQLFGTVAACVVQGVGDLCIVFLASADATELVPVATHALDDATRRGLEELYQEPLVVERHLFLRSVLESGEPLLVPELETEHLRNHTTPRYFEFVRSIGMHTMLSAPLRVHGRSIGVLTLGRYRPRSQPFDEDDVRLACALADRAAIAIANARSYAAEREAHAAAERNLAERVRLEEQLRQSQKMEAVGRLAGGVAHDFNNVLSVILSYGEFLLAAMKPGEPMRDDVEEIRKAGKRAADLTRQLLMFSRQQVLEPKVLDLNELLTSMDKMLQRILGADVDLVSLPARPLGRVRADPSSLEQVIMNLVVNARDAMPTGGQLTMETGNVVLDEAYARDHLEAKPGPHVMLAVTDTGTGMDRATQARIFEPFFTTKGQGKGTGLGLSTVFGIVQQSGGTVWVYSEPGKGTTFKVYLPRVDAEVEATGPAETPASAAGSGTILVVEDDDQVRAVACGILRRSGYHVIEARNAGEALLHSESHPNRIDLLLTDVVMPQMSGPELAKRLARGRPEMKVLCMSGYTDDSIVRHGVLEARIAFLQKPITPESLTTRVREVLEGLPNGRRV